MNTVKAFERPPMQVRVLPTGLTDLLTRLADHAPAVVTALRNRPRGVLREIGPTLRNGLTTQLTELRTELDAALAELLTGPAPHRPATDPLPPTPKPQPPIHITK